MSEQIRDPEEAIQEVAALGEVFIHAGDGLVSDDRRLGNMLATLGDRLSICAGELYSHLDVRTGEPHRIVRTVVRAVGD